MRRWLGPAAALLLASGCGDGGNPLGHGAPPVAATPLAGVNLRVHGPLTAAALDQLEAHHVTWIALVPQGWQPRWDVPQVRLRTAGGPWDQTDTGLIHIMRQARARGLRTLLKPHLRLVHEVPGQWRGTIGFDTEDAWVAWESDYRDFILHYAALAAAEGADMLAIGVELGRSTAARPGFWRDLAARVRAVYDGPLTYGANWDEVEAVSFWDRLDYIGVHAYFPLTDRQRPTRAQLAAGWRGPRRRLEALSARWDRPVLFTEVGYRSVAGAAMAPWEFGTQGPVDLMVQADAYEALFAAFWQRQGFAGLFLWVWDTGVGADADLTTDTGYTPQSKPAAQVLARWFGTTGPPGHGRRVVSAGDRMSGPPPLRGEGEPALRR